MQERHEMELFEVVRNYIRARQRGKLPVTLESAAAYICKHRPSLADNVTTRELAAAVEAVCQRERQAG